VKRQERLIALRLSADLLDAVERCADDDERTLSGMIRKILADQMKRKGYLRDQSRPSKKEA
jgi:hypothetical protein